MGSIVELLVFAIIFGAVAVLLYRKFRKDPPAL